MTTNAATARYVNEATGAVVAGVPTGEDDDGNPVYGPMDGHAPLFAYALGDDDRWVLQPEDTEAWCATHVVVFTDADGVTRAALGVMLCPETDGPSGLPGDGPAYTRSEWLRCVAAEWAVVNGRWQCNDVGTVRVVQL